jgi:hemoglobin-like flavoprotein
MEQATSGIDDRGTMQNSHAIMLHRVRTSFNWFRPCGASLVAATLQRVALQCPELSMKLPESSAQINTRLFATLDQIVMTLDNFERLEKPLAALGKQAYEAGITNPQHFCVVRDCLLAAMGKLGGSSWSHQLHADWCQVLDAVLGAMATGIIEREKIAA